MEEAQARTMSVVNQARKETGEQHGKPRPRRPNYKEIHKDSLPLDVHPLPAFIPHNPLSILRIAYAVFADFFFPPTSHHTIYHGYFDIPTRSVHITNDKFIRGLWERGFFGKGSLSRSEPTWLHSEKTRLGLVEVKTSDQVTRARRKEREQMKKERARLEREAIEQQKLKESNDASNQTRKPEEVDKSSEAEQLGTNDVHVSNGTLHDTLNGSLKTPVEKLASHDKENSESTLATTHTDKSNDILPADPQRQEESIHVENQEHMQLSLEETFFLTYGLGVVTIRFPPEIRLQPANNFGLLQLCRQYSYFPPASISDLQPDDEFLLHYVCYHHFRSLGWVVRDGIKFAVDYLLYQRGPVFNHAEFAVIIMPSYTDTYWFEDEQRRKKIEKKRKEKNWWWLHATNRLLNHVTKTLVLCYIDVPPPAAVKACEEGEDISTLLRLYKIREFSLRRWSSNRNRD